MQVQNVLKTDSLENVINGKFVFCKELKKGFIKGELSSLGLSDYSFENVATVIEGLTLEELETKGLNTVIFVDGEEKISQRMNLEVEAIIAEMENPTNKLLTALLTDRRLKSDYFDESFVQNIIDLGGKEVFFISTDGSNSNDGSYDSPFENLVNVPNGGIVVLKNGLYEGMIQLDKYAGIPKVFYDEKDGEHVQLQEYPYTIIGESRDGVTIQIRKSEARDDNFICTHCDSKLINMTVDHYLTSSTKYEVSISDGTDRTTYDNIIFNIQGNYSLNYHNGTGIEEAVVYNNCQFNGGTRLNNYSGNHIINAESEFSATDSYIQVIQAL